MSRHMKQGLNPWPEEDSQQQGWTTLSFNIHEDIKTYQDKQDTKQLIATKPALPKTPRHLETLNTEEEENPNQENTS